MKDIKTTERIRNPKVKNPMAKIPKELMRTVVLEAKEKSHRAGNMADTGASQESPVEYGSEKITFAEEWAGSKAGDAVSAGGRKLAEKSREKIKEKKVRQRESEALKKAEEIKREPEKDCASESSVVKKEEGNTPETEKLKEKEQIKEKSQEASQKSSFVQGKKEETKGGTVQRTGGENGKLTKSSAEQVKIKVKPEAKDQVKSSACRTVKTAPRIIKASPGNSEQIVKKQVVAPTKQAKHTLLVAKQAAVKSAEAVRRITSTSKPAAKGAVIIMKEGLVAAKAVAAFFGAGVLAMVLLLVVIVGVIGGALSSSNSASSAEQLSQEVLGYTAAIQRYANEYGLSEYVPVIQAIMMQESGGRGTDPMQCSECPYNTQYPNTPGAITDPNYSIQVGIRYYADCVREAGCTSPQDMDKLKLSLQGYNYGDGYITWALSHYGGYSEANALQFSREQAAAHGWVRYGDPEYVPHVLRYYGGGNPFVGLFGGNEQIVSVAKSQLGNAGGQKFWSWYGFAAREEWCACFVSWCADQCGLIQNGSMLKFALCSDGVTWFQSKGCWQGRGYTPIPGTIIFFDWPDRNTGIRDGVSDHVGIVAKCENGTIYTVEGNSSDMVKENSYSIDYGSILGFGTIK